ncbi:MAG: low molecular weight protein-tyrosine phosphatase [Actinomycetota bacterium]|nr:low molecular weight protein-tyrosine phosphatase [Actinomycetota bacterium]
MVCLGNHCRSPYAAAVLTRLGGQAVEVRSAGVRDKHIGRPAHPHMVTVAAARGHDLTRHRGQQVTEELIAWADLVLAMDHANLDAMRTVATPDTRARLALFADDDFPDPWGGTLDDFIVTADTIDHAAARYLR